MKQFVTLLLIFFVLKTHGQSHLPPYPDMVGDITFDPQKDDSRFSLNASGKIFQYHNFSLGFVFPDSPFALYEILNEIAVPTEYSHFSGWIRIRFVVNHLGQADRFRCQGVHANYEEWTIPSALEGQLIDVLRSIKKWSILVNEEGAQDYYQYILFKIEKGQIIEILP